MNVPNQSMRRSAVVKCFNELHLRDDPDELITTITGIWNIALAQPNDGEFPSLGVFECMAKLIDRGVNDPNWISTGKNLYVPYYAAHIIGSYAMNRAEFSEIAVKSGVVAPLMELLRGKMSWVEQRVAVRALGHLASHKRTFKAIAAAHEEEIVNLTMEIASTCLNTVCDQYLSAKAEKRLEYHRDLMTRGRGGPEMEEKKAEEWASQLQCWSLYLLNCFATKKRCINLICKKEFLRELCSMWGGIENQSSFSGVALIRSLCLTQNGRRSIASLKQVIQNLCNLCRSSDEWQWKAIESLLILLKEQETRYQVMDIAAPFLVDLVELKISSKRGRTKVVAAGEMVTQILLQDYGRIKYGQLVLKSKKSEKALEEVWNLKVEKRKRDDMMSEEEFRETRVLVGMLKREGNQKFWSGDTKDAMEKYTRALNLCPLRMRKERTVLYSNRAQCHLILKDAESAISDTTRALSLSGEATPHIKSLWRRSQAYDMNGQARQSLMDCLMFVNQRSKLRTEENVRIPYYAVRMLNKQINATHLFAKAVSASASASRRVINTVGRHESRHEGASATRSRSTDQHDKKKKMTRKINNFFARKVV